VSFAIRRKSKKSEKLGADGQYLFVLAHAQTVLPASSDRRAVALATGVVYDPLQCLRRKPLVEEPVDALGVCGEIANYVVVHQRIDAARILTHQTPAADQVVPYRSTVEQCLRRHLLRTRLYTWYTIVIQYTRQRITVTSCAVAFPRRDD